MRTLFYASILLLSSLFFSCDDDDDKTVQLSDIPVTAQQFLENHFSGKELCSITKDNDSYDVYFKDGFKVDFDLNGNWKEIDGKIQVLPESILNLLPEGVNSYVTEKHPGMSIVKVDKESYGYEIKLSNQQELKFNAEGGFIAYD